MKHNLYLITFLVLASINKSMSQAANNISFYDIIEGDSLHFFFNKNNHYTEKKCADYIRCVRVDSAGSFNGCFEDLDNNQHLLSKGQYVHGNKQGFFELHYSNGQIKSKGNYEMNVPAGQWDYFYEDGMPERTLVFKDKDTLLMRYYNKNGKATVTDGNGDFSGPVAGTGIASSGNGIIAEGKIKNGKPDGKWSSVIEKNITYCNEEFTDGKILKGEFPNLKTGSDKTYNDRSYLSNFFLGSYLVSLEDYRVEACKESAKPDLKNFNYDMSNFSSDIRSKIAAQVERDSRNKNESGYNIGDNYLVIQFSVDKDEKPEKIKQASGWGNQFFYLIASSIKELTKFPPTSEPKFFHLKFHVTGGFSYSYSWRFSNNRNVE